MPNDEKYGSMPFKNGQAAKADRFDMLKAGMESKIAAVEQKIGGTKAGSDEIRSIRGSHERAMAQADPKKWQDYMVGKSDPSTQYTTLNKYGQEVSRQGREHTIDKK